MSARWGSKLVTTIQTIGASVQMRKIASPAMMTPSRSKRRIRRFVPSFISAASNEARPV